MSGGFAIARSWAAGPLRPWQLAIALVAGAFALGCGERDPAPDADVSVEVGTPQGTSELAFVPLQEKDPIYIDTFGQGGTHALLAIRCSGFGERAFVTAWLMNVETGQRASLTTPAPQPLACDDEGKNCDLMPILMMTGGFGKPETLEGLKVQVGGRCRNEEGSEAEATQVGLLSTERLPEVGEQDE